jgi:DNA-binding XRE family transcriptional regulator
METEKQLDCLYTRKQAAKLLHVAVRTLTRIEQRGELPRVQISPRVIGYRDSALQQFIAAKTITA